MSNKLKLNILPPIEDAEELQAKAQAAAEVGAVRKHGAMNPEAAKAQTRAQARREKAAKQKQDLVAQKTISVQVQPDLHANVDDHAVRSKKTKMFAAALAVLGIAGLVAAFVVTFSGTAQANPGTQLAMANVTRPVHELPTVSDSLDPKQRVEVRSAEPKNLKDREHCKNMRALMKAHPELVERIEIGRYGECTAMFTGLIALTDYCETNPCSMNGMKKPMPRTIPGDAAPAVEEVPAVPPAVQQPIHELSTAPDAPEPKQRVETPPECAQFGDITVAMLLEDRKIFERHGLNLKGEQLLTEQAKSLTPEAQQFVKSSKAKRMLVKRVCGLTGQEDPVSERELERTVKNLQAIINNR